MKKLVSLILSLALLMSLFAIPAAAADVSYSDTSGHWAATEINSWTSRGIIQGSEGLFRPEDPITRGEFAVILNRIMAYKTAASNTFTDLQSTEFYTEAVLKAANYGVITGYPDKTVRPTSNITRQEAFVMIYRAFGFTAVSGYTLKAKDASDVLDYAVEAVSSFESKGIIKGRGEGMLYPASNITRAETIKLLDNFVSEIYKDSGTYTANAAAYVVVNASGVVLKDMTISGSLVIAPGVGDGTVTLNNVKVSGDVIVLGGGPNSIVVSGSSTVDGTIYIRKQDGVVRVFNSSGTELKCEIVKGSDDVILEGSFSKVVVEEEVTITVPTGTTISNLELNAVTSISGSGKIENATISSGASGSSFSSKPDKLAGAEGETVYIGGTLYTHDGTTFVPPTGGGSSGTSVKTSSVTLFLSNNLSGINLDASSGSCTFDLSSISSYPDATIITDIQINTDIDSKYVVGGYFINTNEKVKMSTFLEFLGLNTSAIVTLGKIRGVADSCTVTGKITNGDTLEVSFNVGSVGYYTLTNDGTTITAKLEKEGTIDSVKLGGKDPVALLVSNITDRTTGPYTLVASRSGVRFERSYTDYSSISSLNLSSLVASMKSSFTSLDNLSNLTGITVQISYGSKTFTLKFV